MNSFMICVFVLIALQNVQGFNPFNPKDPEISPLIDPCAAETGVDASRMKSETPLTKEEIMELYKDHKFKCFSTCVMKGLGFIKDGEFDLETIKSKLEFNDEEFQKLKECVENNKQEDECDRAAAVKLCAKKIIKDRN